jgi:hypothetical protein
MALAMTAVMVVMMMAVNRAAAAGRAPSSAGDNLELERSRARGSGPK